MVKLMEYDGYIPLCDIEFPTNEKSHYYTSDYGKLLTAESDIYRLNSIYGRSSYLRKGLLYKDTGFSTPLQYNSDPTSYVIILATKASKPIMIVNNFYKGTNVVKAVIKHFKTELGYTRSNVKYMNLSEINNFIYEKVIPVRDLANSTKIINKIINKYESQEIQLDSSTAIG